MRDDITSEEVPDGLRWLCKEPPFAWWESTGEVPVLIGLVLAILLLLAGCGTTETFKHTPVSKLCTDYLSYPAMNVWQGAREAELARRGESCQDYTEAGLVARQLRQQETETAIRLLTPPPPPAPLPRPVQCRTTCAYGACNTTCY